ncbi:MAG: hypothetical protein HY293_04905 [Planctomycetes bacterium]|nr:hypothetical protein [Planctomycetota bacterium]
MPDLFTHFVAARVPGAFLSDRRLQALLILGTFLPDIASKGLYWVFQTHETFSTGSHSIAGMLLVSYLACLFLEEPIRRPGFAALAAGGLIHLLVDLVKYNLGMGSGRPFLPFSPLGVELGWIDSENVVLLVPLDAAVLGILWFLERRSARVQQ